MPKIQLKGKIVHPAGPWGVAVPVKGAAIAIYDRDIPGRGDDLILQTQTTDTGEFSGLGAEWRDKVVITPGHSSPFGNIPPVTANDPTDLPMISVVVTRSAAQTFVAPPVLLPLNTTQFEFPPIIVPWPPGRAPVRVNGQDCWSGVQVSDKVAGSLKNGQNFTIELIGPEADAIAPFKQSDQAVQAWLASHCPGYADAMGRLKQSRNGTAGLTGAEEIVAAAILVLAVYAGMAVLTVAVGVMTALLLAIVLGYDVKLETEQEAQPDGSVKQKVRFVAVKRTFLIQ